MGTYPDSEESQGRGAQQSATLVWPLLCSHSKGGAVHSVLYTGSIESGPGLAFSSGELFGHQQHPGTVYPRGMCCSQGLAGAFSTAVASSTNVCNICTGEQKGACCPELPFGTVKRETVPVGLDTGLSILVPLPGTKWYRLSLVPRRRLVT